MTQELKIPKKLIEVALPLDAINEACHAEGSPFVPRHPRSLHIWWARRRLAAVRAVLFAQLINDPGYERALGRGMNKENAATERRRLFDLIRQLVKWENLTNEGLLSDVRAAIKQSWEETCKLNEKHPEASTLFNPKILPGFHDPFSGGGAIPMEAQRFGLSSTASDLNPVAVLINRAMIEILPKFTGRSPVSSLPSQRKQAEMPTSSGLVAGFSSDLESYGSWMRDMAAERLRANYPKVKISSEMAKERPELRHLIGKELEVIAWLWARTVSSPNPAFSHIKVPLIASTWLSKKDGKTAWVEIKKTDDSSDYLFQIRMNGSPTIEDTVRKTGATCVMSGSPIDLKYIRDEAKAGRLGTRLISIVVSDGRGRIYLPPSVEAEQVAINISSPWKPTSQFMEKALGFRIGGYGFKCWGDIFTERQATTLATLCDLIPEVHARVIHDANANGWESVAPGLEGGGNGSRAYADAICTFLSLAVSRWADLSNSMVTWNNTNQNIRALFSKQAIPMTWDFAEVNPFGRVAPWYSVVESHLELLSSLPTLGEGVAKQASAMEQDISINRIVSTDPPYYDNIGYADLSDFFFVWLQRAMGAIYPSLLQASGTPKEKELVATPARHGGKREAEEFFLNGMIRTFEILAKSIHPAFPMTVFYAFKQSEKKDKEIASTGWEVFLEGVIRSGFAITGTWPINTERKGRSRDIGSNALASSIVLVCRKRPTNAPAISRREFLRELNVTMPEALDEMTRGGDQSPVAPVDLNQAIIGPGMAIYSKYSAVLEADGKPMSVRTALGLINRYLTQDDFDSDTQFCLEWFDSYGWDRGKFGDADILARAKGTSVDGLRDGGIVESASGYLRLLKPTELSPGWKPESDSRVSVWELLHHMIRELNTNGESGAGEILARANSVSESIRSLAYRLYTTCERKGWAPDANNYDGIVRAWDAIESAARAVGYSGSQISLFDSTPSTNESQNPTKSKSRKKK